MIKGDLQKGFTTGHPLVLLRELPSSWKDHNAILIVDSQFHTPFLLAGQLQVKL